MKRKPGEAWEVESTGSRLKKCCDQHPIMQGRILYENSSTDVRVICEKCKMNTGWMVEDYQSVSKRWYYRLKQKERNEILTDEKTEARI